MSGTHVRTVLTTPEGATGLLVESILGDGSGVFQYPVQVGDVNGDGRTDLIFSFYAPSLDPTRPTRLRTALGQADGTFAPTVDTRLGDGSGIFQYPVQVGDVDGDGRTDLIFAYYAGAGLGTRIRTALALADDPGRFSPTVQTTLGDGDAVFQYPVQVGDVDGDGRTDLIFTFYVPSLDPTRPTRIRTALARADRPGEFYPTVDTLLVDGFIFQYPVQVGDLNGDGRTDLIFTFYDSTLGMRVRTALASRVYNGKFGGTVDTVLGDGTLTLHGTGDVTGDRRPDLIFSFVSSADGSTHIRTAKSKSDGHFHGTRETVLGDHGTGHDVLLGGAGNDALRGFEGNDVLEGEAGQDTLHGDQGRDQLYGGPDNDFVYGGDGEDILSRHTIDYAINGSEYMDGGAGDDTLEGGAGGDTLLGGAGNDVLHGFGGNDRLEGAEGRDVLQGGDGFDTSKDDFNPFQWVIGGYRATDVVQGRAPTSTILATLAAATNRPGFLAGKIAYLGNNEFGIRLYRKELLFGFIHIGTSIISQTVSFDGTWTDNDAQPPVGADGIVAGDFWATLYQRAVLQEYGVNWHDPDTARWGTGWQQPDKAMFTVAGEERTFRRGESLLSVIDLRDRVRWGNLVTVCTANHCYAVLDVFQVGNQWHVTLYNPWGIDAADTPMAFDGGARNDGLFTIAWTDFGSYFQTYCWTDW
ncbi:MAG: FG-GAP-like repeat-containing protein [Gemmataceae bacterium]|nr:FG-GAP-like repeat-containing protein [Gemmataceae bacterium]